MALTPLQWLGIAIMAVGALVYAWPRIRALIPARTSQPAADTMDDLLDRMGRLAALQADLEARGHTDEADMAGSWYSLLRDPVRDQEARQP
jgi:hypothetical protein